MKRSLIGGAFAKEAEHHGIDSLQTKSQRRADGEWDTAAHDAIRSQHAPGDVRNVHAPAFTAAIPVGPAEDLGHHAAHVKPASNAVTVPAMGAGEEIAVLHCGARADRNCLHTDA